MNGSKGEPRRRPHVLMASFPIPGHYYPFLQLLHQCALYEDITVTMISTEERVFELRSQQQKGDFNDLDLRLEPVFPPFYTPGSSVSADPFTLKTSMTAWDCYESLRVKFEPFATRLIEQKDSPGGPTCIVADNFTALFTQDAASRLGIPWYPLVVATPAYLSSYFEGPRLRELRHRSSPGGHEPLDIPGLEFTRLRDIPYELFHCPPDFVNCQADIFSRASAIVINTAAELVALSGTLEGIKMSMERQASADNRQAPRIFCVGPMLNFPGFRGPAEHRSSDQTPSSSSSAARCFLNSHAPRSVLYVCFGSIATTFRESVTELAHGLEASGVPFLWVLKVSGLSSGASLLPAGFQDRLRGRGFIEEDWASQPEVLLHPSTGGFLSHCGWNSVHESFCTAMPLITWPIGVEQQLSARFVEKIAKTGIPVRHFAAEKDVDEASWDVLPTRSEIQRAVTFLMIEEAGKELRKNAQKMKKIVTDAVAENGSSQRSLRVFLDEILLQSTRKTK